MDPYREKCVAEALKTINANLAIRPRKPKARPRASEYDLKYFTPSAWYIAKPWEYKITDNPGLIRDLVNRVLRSEETTEAEHNWALDLFNKFQKRS